MSEIMKDVQVDLVLPSISVTNYKQVLQTLVSEVSGHVACNPEEILSSLMEAEKNNSSGMGEGVAIPHARLPGLVRSFGTLATLKKPVNFYAPDDAPVDLVFLLLSPEEDGPLHLRRLSRISRLLGNVQLCNTIRETEDAETIRSLITAPAGWMMAA